ncbi:prolyl oligopeptidase-like protein [Xylariomycetidae sp. FL0641]|nr:prolyl oligopeptidase-like protein [Xylariomycetidae sp. FL0641]
MLARRSLLRAAAPASPRIPLPLPLPPPQRRAYASAPSLPPADERVPLAYDHHKPEKGGRGAQDAPVVFLHGLFGSKKNNRTVSRFLARELQRHVFAVDLRNHGETAHAPRHDYLAMAGDVAGFVAQHGLASPTLIGHSMGAKTAMALALSAEGPRCVRDLVAVDNAPLDAALSSAFPRYVRGLRRVDEAAVSRLSDADRILAEYEESEPIRQFLLGNLHRPPGSGGAYRSRVPLGVLGRALDHMGDFPFRDPEAARFDGPALFVRGTKSRYVADEALPVIGRFFPRFRCVDIDAGHWLISEKPQEFLKAVVEFLSPKE